MHSFFLKRIALSLCLALATYGEACADTTPVPDSPAVERRVDNMLAKLTLEQKVELLSGVDNFSTHAEPQLGLPALTMSDGPYGVRGVGPSTAYMAGIGLAASWDPALAQRVGEAMGRDARARGINFLLGPGVNMYRAPQNGRNMEYYGEDPYLAGSMAVGLIDGVQSQGVVATVKHFAANNSEYDRRHLDTHIDERTLHEIYLPAFEMAVKQGHVGAVMSSYNLVNGDYAAENRELGHDILQQDWGFDGIYMSDWGATSGAGHDWIKAYNAGLDLEMPAPDAFSAPRLLAALHDGKLSSAMLDDKVRRILRTAVRFGFLDRPQKDLTLPLFSLQNDRVALEGALEGLVLLKNDRQQLPLDAAHIKTLAVIGPNAEPAIASAGGSSHVDTFQAQSLLAGITRLVGDKVRVLYSRGLPSAMDVFKQSVFTGPGGQPGLLKETFANDAFQGKPGAAGVEPHVDQWKPELWTTPAKHRQSIRWSGSFVPQHDGQYLFLTAAASEDTYVLYVDGKPVITQPHREGQAPLYATLTLHARQPVSIRLDYKPDVDYSRMGLGVIAIDDLIAPDARKMAALADAAVVAVGFDPSSESEAYDRTFQLPWGQEALIDAVAAANPHTVVTVTSGGGYATADWLERVPALLQNWYPGQQGGTAMAQVLFGEHAPEGKLPISFERAWADNPVHDWYDAAPYPAGSRPSVTYGEGVFLGYRWYSSHPDKPQPLFAFGYGLSYTSFAFAQVAVKLLPNEEAEVSFDIRNTGQRAGADVAQVYVGDPSAAVARPARELKAFRKVRLQPGQTQHVSLHLDRRAFAYYDVGSHGWKVDPGLFKIYVGDASNNTPLQADVTLTH
ncbi:glycoside hydrolase family 3 C-terminal domain-containing protein [Dyella acidiphila]|uniref:Glycoside hydrolase family 3 C-terminal domain-containing protein n=1 Tax=Dyella acidiphila TaxID=2775866 RepID=A0ABR9GD00_9GAMM|nr:glycoside hydrolase family 3 C-terminal domain-containing protein [Dyella acidiphila]MBE1161928.1 glycoside hydrolase family 3 C-terminal domain-containing protein [Dyella acidiphila]